MLYFFFWPSFALTDIVKDFFGHEFRLLAFDMMGRVPKISNKKFLAVLPFLLL